MHAKDFFFSFQDSAVLLVIKLLCIACCGTQRVENKNKTLMQKSVWMPNAEEASRGMILRCNVMFELNCRISFPLLIFSS